MKEVDQMISVGPVPLMKQSEVARLFRCIPRTIRTWTKKGWLVPFAPVGSAGSAAAQNPGSNASQTPS
jgi:hypothetical protein